MARNRRMHTSDRYRNIGRVCVEILSSSQLVADMSKCLENPEISEAGSGSEERLTVGGKRVSVISHHQV